MTEEKNVRHLKLVCEYVVISRCAVVSCALNRI